eukprot:4409954-Prymnesium_polylepis.1
MGAHAAAPDVQLYGCRALGNVAFGTDAAANARRQAIVGCGALPAVAAAMQAHPTVLEVQSEGCRAVGFICGGTDAEGGARREGAVEAGALPLCVAPMRVYVDDVRHSAFAIEPTQDRAAAAFSRCCVLPTERLVRCPPNPWQLDVQVHGCAALAMLCIGTD